MRQKFSVNIADIQMNIVCDETQETVDAAATELDKQVRALLTGAGSSYTKAEVALLCALDYGTRLMHMQERVQELENYISSTDPTGDTYEANLLRGENETLRAQLQVSRGNYDALLQDNATLFQLNAKLARQNGDSNTRADRMHDQVLSILTEVRELREKLASMCVDTRPPSPSYSVYEKEPEIEITPEEQQVTHKYEQMDLEAILNTAPQARNAATPSPANPMIDDTATEPKSRISDLLDFEGKA